MKKRIISTVLAVLMMASMIPVSVISVLAAETDETGTQCIAELYCTKCGYVEASETAERINGTFSVDTAGDCVTESKGHYSFEVNSFRIIDSEKNTLQLITDVCEPYLEEVNGEKSVNYDFLNSKETAYKGDIIIPETVSYAGKIYTVTEIGDANNFLLAPFSNCEELTYVDIPDTVKLIGVSAFSGCSKIREVIIPNSVETICSMAFRCPNLEKIAFKSVGITSFADGVTVNATAGYYIKNNSVFEVWYSSDGANKGRFIGTEYRCYNDTARRAGRLVAAFRYPEGTESVQTANRIM